MSWFSEVLSILGSQQTFQLSWASTYETRASGCVAVGTCHVVRGSEAGCGARLQLEVVTAVNCLWELINAPRSCRAITGSAVCAWRAEGLADPWWHAQGATEQESGPSAVRQRRRSGRSCESPSRSERCGNSDFALWKNRAAYLAG